MEDSVNLNRQIHISSSNGLHPLLKVPEPGRMGRSGVVEEGPQGGKKFSAAIRPRCKSSQGW